MIEFTKSYKTSTGKVFESIEEAQIEELSAILSENEDRTELTVSTANLIVENAENIIDVLTTGPRSKPKARSINGGTKKRTPKTVGTLPVSQSAA